MTPSPHLPYDVCHWLPTSTPNRTAKDTPMRHLRILTLLTAATIAPVLLLTACSPTTPSSRDADAAEASKLPADDTVASSAES